MTRADGRPRRPSRPAPTAAAADRTGQDPGRGGVGWRALAIVLVGIAVYGNSLAGPFLLDDQSSIVANTQIRDWRHLDLLFPARESPVAGRPLINISFAVNYAIGGLSVRGYHLANIALHLCCALLLFGVVRRTLQLPRIPAWASRRSIDIGFIAALIWVVHPLASEVVDYLTQRTESIMAIFYLATMYGCARAATSARPARWQTLAVASCWLGMASKESMVSAPVMALLYNGTYVYPSVTQALKARWRFHAALASAWAGLAAIMATGPRLYTVGFSLGVSPWQYALNQSVMVTRYLRLAIWPRALVLNYGWPVTLAFGDVAPYVLFIAAIVALSLVLFATKPQLGFLSVWVFVTLAPTSSLVPIATEVGAERRMYLPLMAIVVLGTVLGVCLWDRWRPRLITRSAALVTVLPALPLLLIGGVVVPLAAATASRNREYATNLGIARTVLDRWPSSFAEHMVGTALADAGQHDEAMPHLRTAMKGFPKARYNLGWELFHAGRFDEAIEQLTLFARDEPIEAEVLSAWDTIGRAFAAQHRWPEAIEQYRKVLAVTPRNGAVHGRLADALFGSGASLDAIEAYRGYLAEYPNDAGALSNLGISLMAVDRGDDALVAFERAAAVSPNDADPHRNLATALFDRRDIAGAAVQAERAVQLAPNDPAAHDLLGRICAVQGRLDEARRQFELALHLEPGNIAAREDLRRLKELQSSAAASPSMTGRPR